MSLWIHMRNLGLWSVFKFYWHLSRSVQRLTWNKPVLLHIVFIMFFFFYLTLKPGTELQIIKKKEAKQKQLFLWESIVGKTVTFDHLSVARSLSFDAPGRTTTASATLIYKTLRVPGSSYLPQISLVSVYHSWSEWASGNVVYEKERLII